MKSLKNSFSPLKVINLLWLALLLFSCTKDNCKQKYTYTKKIPKYLSYQELREPVKGGPPQPVEDPGKIYFTNEGYLFVNEKFEGIHVIDNRDPGAPQKLAFIKIPGNIDMAVDGDVLYADCFIDLVTLDISDPVNAKEIYRLDSIFPYKSRFQGLDSYNPSKGVVIGYEEKEVTEVRENVDCNGRIFRNTEQTFVSTNANPSPGNTNPGGSGGQGGSMARFALNYEDGYLYSVNNRSLNVFNLSSPFKPTFSQKVNIGFGIETIFPYKENLFIGSVSGMFIYDATDPVNPTRLSRFSHVTSCDPVVAEDNYAYVTLRGGTPCGGFTDQLDVIDIQDLNNPELIKSYSMENPYGLDVDSKKLFVCDGDAGLKVYDASDPEKIDKNQLAHFERINGYDAIAYEETLMVVAEDGIYQYDYSDIKNIELMSVIPVKNSNGSSQ